MRAAAPTDAAGCFFVRIPVGVLDSVHRVAGLQAAAWREGRDPTTMMRNQPYSPTFSRISALTVGPARTGIFTILALVALRLAAGWHFFSEGSEKLAFDPEDGEYRVTFSAEPFLIEAKGPLAETMQDFAPSGHEWRGRLAEPQEWVPLSEEERIRREEWMYDYNQRRAQAQREKTVVPIEIPDFSPYAAWARKVIEDWQATLDSFLQTPNLSDEQREQAVEVFALRHQQLVDYLEAQSETIAEYRHELWRLENLKESPMTGEVPFHDQRIAMKTSETVAQPRSWLVQVYQIEQNFENELRGLLTADQRADKASQESLHEAFIDRGEARLGWVNWAVTCLTVGVGVCLLLGFFTRLASLAGMSFLLAVMASQPPWVAGAQTEYFHYQLVELAALAVLFVVGAGRWFGLDFFTYALWNRIAGRSRDDD
jgi:uncharacterized membrane protein YphA (DoxX/SURF4 family)